jgi:hypothetical protein
MSNFNEFRMNNGNIVRTWAYPINEEIDFEILDISLNLISSFTLSTRTGEVDNHTSNLKEMGIK